VTADRERRLDIEGPRALAVVLVLLYHAGLPPSAGFLGVDVFFVISGFLITGLLVRELHDTGTVSWRAFVARRARRLLPAAVLVLVVTAIGSWFLVPGLRRIEIGHDVIGAALYVVNWVLAGRAVSYLQSDALPSPVQHYWSLAVEEQFYVVWPLLLVVATWLLRRAPRFRGIGVLLAVLCVPSFAWSVWLTSHQPETAYFVTTTRIWELGLGAALAVYVASRGTRHTGRPGVGLAIGAGVLGLGLILATAILLPGNAGWPGAWAVLPTAGTALALYAGWAAPGRGVAALLSRRACVWVGGLSYSLYLWHWPMRVLGEWWLGHGRWVPIAAIVVSVLPAWLAHRYVEVPLHTGRGLLGARLGRKPARWLVAGAALSLAGVLAGSGLLLARSPFPSASVPGSSGVAPGAAALGSPPSQADVAFPAGSVPWLTPDPLRAGEDRPDADVDRCQVDTATTVPVRCEFGVAGGPVTVALVGDSKAMQWLPALQAGAQARGWRILTFGKGSCTYSAAPAARAGAAYPECDAWNQAVTAALLREHPDLVITSANPSVLGHAPLTAGEVATEGFTSRWRELQSAGMPVLVIANSPRSPDDLDVCAARHPDGLGRCSYDRKAATEHIGNQALAAAALDSGADYLDLTNWLCPGTRCPVAVGSVTIARPGDHVTATYARSLAPVVLAAAEASLARKG
jgi:peptidoglycan/LPS O-acetylase OafA/YrhL